MKPLLQSTEEDVAALDAVCERLQGFGVRASAEWVDGFLCALLAGRRVVPPSEWLAAMFGEEFDRVFADPADVQQAMAALLGRWNVLANQLDPESLVDAPDQMRLSPLMLVYDDELRAEIIGSGELTEQEVGQLQTGALWALGFRDAIDAFAEDWPEPAPDSEDGAVYNDCLSRVLALGLPEDELTGYVDESYPDKTVTRDQLIDDACFGVQDLRVYWLDHAIKPAQRRVEPRPGRNDPCPCGSGKKFKKCHGTGLH